MAKIITSKYVFLAIIHVWPMYIHVHINILIPNKKYLQKDRETMSSSVTFQFSIHKMYLNQSVYSYTFEFIV